MATLAHVFAVLKHAQRKGNLLVGIAVLAVLTSSEMMLPWIGGRIVDSALQSNGARDALLRWSIALAVAASLAAMARASSRLIFFSWAAHSVSHVRKRMLEHLQRLEVKYFDDERSGRVTALFTTDTPLLAEIYHPLTQDALMSVLQLIAIGIIVSANFGEMAVVLALLIPIYLIFPLLFSKKIRSRSRRLQESRAQCNSEVQEVIDGVREIKAFEQQAWTSRRVGAVFDTVVRRGIRAVRVGAFAHLDYALFWTVVALVYWWGGLKVQAGEITVGELVAFVGYVSFVGGPVERLVAINTGVQRALGGAQRILDFLRMPVEGDGGTGERLPAGRPPAVEFQGVTFAYDEGAEPALRQISFRAEPGERIAIVGPSGSGKSTLIKLLLRFYAPREGALLIDGKPIGDYDLAALREGIGIVFQEPFLFAGTVRENILFGRPDASEEAIRRAAEIANAAGFIAELPQGYDTPVGERGGKLSVGQKQRIAIARVALRDARMAILDEATSALDAASEHLVQEALQRIMQGKTCFVIAHRLATVRNADRILLLEDGRLTAQGRHGELLGTSPTYQRLCHLQLSGDRETAESG